MQSSHTWYIRSLRTSFAFTLLVLIGLGVCRPTDIRAQGYDDPLFEISLGGEARLLSASADWNAERYMGGQLSIAMNLFAGLGIEGGRGIAYGEALERDMFVYGSHRILNGALKPAIYTSFLGLRYTIPARRIRPQGLFATESIRIGAGMVWDRFYIRSDEYWYYTNEFGWETNDIAVSTNTGDRKDTAADIDGYYVSLAGRWRLSSQMGFTENGNGQYGIDAGIRYLIYTDSKLAKDTLDNIPESLSATQIFVNLFIKLDLFY